MRYKLTLVDPTSISTRCNKSHLLRMCFNLVHQNNVVYSAVGPETGGAPSGEYSL